MTEFKDVHPDITFAVEEVFSQTGLHPLEGWNLGDFLVSPEGIKRLYLQQRLEAERGIEILKIAGIFDLLNSPDAKFGKSLLRKTINNNVDGLGFLGITEKVAIGDIDAFYEKGLVEFSRNVAQIFAVDAGIGLETFFSNNSLRTDDNIVAKAYYLAHLDGYTTETVNFTSKSDLLGTPNPEVPPPPPASETDRNIPKKKVPAGEGSPTITQRDINIGILTDDKVKPVYKEEEAKGFSETERKQKVKEKKIIAMIDSLRVERESLKQQIADGLDEGFDPTLEEQLEELQEDGEDSEDFLVEKATSLVEDEGEKSESEVVEQEKPDEPTKEDGAGESLGPDENFPMILTTTKIKERKPPAPPKEVLGEGPFSGDGLVLDQISTTVPPLAPLGSMGIGSLFMEPISRQMFVLVFTSPVGFFWLGINIPCMYPIILPPFYPITPVGPPPAGLFAAMFIDPTLPYCGGSNPVDMEAMFKYLNRPTARLEPQDIEPCNPDLEYSQYSKCVRELNKTAGRELDGVPISEGLRKMLKLIQELSKVPTPEPKPTVKPKPQDEIIITTEDDLDEFDFELNIIE